MAVVGEAYVLVRANTSGVERDIKNGFNRIAGSASAGGRTAGQRFSQAFNSASGGDNVFSKFSAGIRAAVRDADSARNTFHNLVREGYALGTAFAGAVGGISAAIGGITSLAGAAAGAIGSVAALGNTVASLGLGLGVAKLALGGIGKAVKAITTPSTGGGGGSSGGSKGSAGTNDAGYSAAQQKAAQVAARKAQEAYAKAVASANEQVADAEKNLAQVIQANRERMVDANNDVRDAQKALNEAFAEGRKEMRDLGFSAEDAALKEKQAGLDLQKARAALAAVQDLPPNSAARQAAELSYAQAELAYREAKASAADLQAEQQRLAKTGVQGTDAVTQATKNLKDAQDAQTQAARDSLQDQIDAQDALTDAKKEAAETKADKPQTEEQYLADKVPTGASSGGSSSGGGGADPFAGLNQAQINFAKFIASLKPKFDELKEIAANGFLPPLQEAIQNLVDKAFPTVANGVDIIAKAMGAAVISLSQAITSGDHMADLTTIFEMSGQVIRDLGKALGSAFGIVVTLMAAAAPLTERFTNYIVQAADALDKFLDQKQATGELEGFFKRSGDIMAQFGEIFGNIFNGIGDIIAANFGPGSGGQIMLDFLKNATKGFAEMGDSAEGKANLTKYFQDVAKNAIEVFKAIGGILDVFIKLGANPAIGEAFAILQQGKEPLEAIVKASADAAPAMAELVNKVLEIIKLLQDTGAIEVFFDTLSSIADTIIDVLSNPAVQQITIITGRFAAALAAFGLVGKGISFGFSALSGSVALASGTVGKFVTVGKGVAGIGKSFATTAKLGGNLAGTFAEMTYSANPLTKAVGRIGGVATKAGSGLVRGFKGGIGVVKSLGSAVGGVLKVGAKLAGGGLVTAFKVVSTALVVGIRAIGAAISANPIGAIITAITIAVGAFIYFYNNVKPFRDFINGLGKAIADGFMFALNLVITGINVVVEFFKGLVAVVGAAIQPVFDFLVGLFLNFTPLGIVISNIGPIMDFIVGLFTNIGSFIATALANINLVISTVINAIAGVWNSVWGGIGGVLMTLWDAYVSTVTIGINFVLNIIRTVINTIRTVWTSIWTAISTAFQGIWNGIKTFVSAAIGFVRDIISNVVNIIKAIWSGNWSAIGKYLQNIWNDIKGIVRAGIDFVRTVINNVLGAIRDIWSSIWNGIKSTFNSIWNNIVNAVKSFGKVFRDAFSGIKGFVTSAFTGVLNAVRTPINGIIGLVNKAIGSLNGLSVKIPDWVPIVGGQKWGLNIPKIPQLAKGGTVMPSRSGTLVNVAEAGRPERIEPLNTNGLSDRDEALIAKLAPTQVAPQIVVNGAPGQDVTELAAIVSREVAWQMRKGGTR